MPTFDTKPVDLSDYLWTVKDAAGYLRMPVSSVYKMTGARAPVVMPHLKIAGRLRFRKADLDRWLDLLLVSEVPTLVRVRERLEVEKEIKDGLHPQTKVA
jgi:excisionase family DNA binding protein